MRSFVRAACVVALCAPLCSARQGGGVPASPVPFDKVTITDSLWRSRQEANAKGTLTANFEQCEKTGRFANFDRAAKGEGKYEGLFFNDSDVYKAIEGACWVLQQTRDEALDKALDSLIARIAAAQQPDGYLNAFVTLMEADKRWADLPQKHEMYCAGHLIEAGVAHHRVTGKRTLLDVAIRFADLIDATFGPPPKRNGVCGHEEIEIALLKLWQETGQQKYRDLASYFVAQRGRSEHVGATNTRGETRPLFGEYCQDHAPLADQQHVVGHAVRAMYLYCAAADLARLAGERTYVPALERAWDDLTGTKMYITGGIGNSAKNEGFTSAYDLPNDSAYAETCAGIGLVMWGHRMALLHADAGARYMDVVERGLYNGVLSGVSLDGSRFFYVNPLGSRGNHHRQEWFACACCPPNILRLVAQVGGMIYAQTPDSLLVNLYIANRADVTFGGADTGVKAGVEVTTAYPWDGEVTITVTPAAPVEHELLVRIPEWCREAKLRVNDAPVDGVRRGGYLGVKRTWRSGDTLKLSMPMPIERMRSHPGVKGNVGRVAIQRGPVVYCFEGADNPGVQVRQAALPAASELRAERVDSLLGGVTVIRAEGQVAGATAGAKRLYAPDDARSVTLTAIPYCVWDNREPGEMLVWMPESLALAEKPLDPTIRPAASHCWRADTLTALYDEQLPESSSDHSIPRMTFWPRRGSTEWVEYQFTEPRSVSGVEVYWFDDRKSGGGCAVPESWRVLCRKGDEWVEVAGEGCGVKPDTFNTVRFTPVTTQGVRLEVKLRSGASAASAGILEWRVLE